MLLLKRATAKIIVKWNCSKKKMLIFLIGYMGSGKTTIGRGLARRLGLRFIDMDAEVESRAGMSVSEIFAAQGEAEFRRQEQTVLQALAEEKDAVVATGGGTPCFFDNMEVMNAAGLTIYLKMGPEKLVSRLTNGIAKRPLLRDKTPEQLLDFIAGNLESREPFYGRAKIVMACDTMSDEYIAGHVAMYVEHHKERRL